MGFHKPSMVWVSALIIRIGLVIGEREFFFLFRSCRVWSLAWPHEQVRSSLSLRGSFLEFSREFICIRPCLVAQVSLIVVELGDFSSFHQDIS